MADRNTPRVYDGIIDFDGEELKSKPCLDRINGALFFCLDCFDCRKIVFPRRKGAQNLAFDENAATLPTVVIVIVDAIMAIAVINRIDDLLL